MDIADNLGELSLYDVIGACKENNVSHFQTLAEAM